MLVRFCQAVLRRFTPRYRVVHPERLVAPGVYLCRHADIYGIVLNLLWLPVPVRTWGLHVFGDRRACCEHLREITFGARYGWPRWKATVLAWLASYGLTALYRSARVIPVYRGSAQVLKTFRESTAALKQGERLLIFPDRDYASTDAEVSELYDGFLSIDRFYHKATGRHIPFVPLYIDRAARTITVCEPVTFADDRDRKAQTAELIGLLQQRLGGHGC
ncbi:hypothetical protein J2Z79_000216 [Symbiobacterium terraclitae]|uniref:Phospholipid/glycerol acyltransferase domain-containing protein n=1 Tax=Symbiobacterium terraclitae TaxID=557451 RepID=A0ABS4JMS7_9FIRM|nr:hypothetical protein [Symbiobacterium terraclitae]MBP2016843.1 hypothetical protein [Symbiobacterium terraclitae]